MNRVNPKLTSNLWDFVRAASSGLVRNGHVILFVVVCFGAAYMARGLLGLAVLVDEPPEPPQEVVVAPDESDEPAELVQEPIESLLDPMETFLQASDERIGEHYRCTYTEYRRDNEDACDAIAQSVADAIRRDKGSEGLR